MSQDESDQADIEKLAKHIQDLQQLVTLLLKGLARAKPWQRQLAGHLGDVEHQLQVLRLTVAMDKPFAELFEASEQLLRTCRLSSAVLAGTRADKTTRTAVMLAGDLAEQVRKVLSERLG